MLLPNCGPLPQISHTCAIVQLQIFECFTEAGTRRDAVRAPSPEACRISSIQRMRAQRQGPETRGQGSGVRDRAAAESGMAAKPRNVRLYGSAKAPNGRLHGCEMGPNVRL